MPRKANIQNLTPFKKGQCGNPKGRPKKLPDLDVLMAEVMGEEQNGKTAAQAILSAMRARAAKGDVKAAQLLLDRAYGKVKQSVELGGDIGILWKESRNYGSDNKTDTGS